MPNRKQRMKNRATALELYYKLPPKNRCPNCNELTHHGHYLPAVLGGTSGWICEAKSTT